LGKSWVDILKSDSDTRAGTYYLNINGHCTPDSDPLCTNGGTSTCAPCSNLDRSAYSLKVHNKSVVLAPAEYIGSCKAVDGSVKLSNYPTASPTTPVTEIVTFTAAQELGGITQAQWDGDSKAKQAFVNTVSAVLGTPSSYVSLVNAVPYRLQSTHEKISNWLFNSMNLLSGGLKIGYTVSVVSTGMGSSAAQDSFNAANAKMSASVSNGEFLTLLQKSATQLGTNILASVTTGAYYGGVTYTVSQPPPTASGSKDSQALSDDAKIAIGVVVGVVGTILTYVAYVYLCNGKYKKANIDENASEAGSEIVIVANIPRSSQH